MFLLYNLVLALLSPLWIPWMLLRAGRREQKPNWRERFGDYSLPRNKGAKRVWLHAVSVGEVMAALPILRELKKTLADYEIVLSVTTTSGHRTARERAEGLYDHLVYFPIDVVRFQLRAMERVRPKVVAVMETELWMNFLWAAKAMGARTLLVNGRISDRSFPRSKRFRFFYRALLSMVERCLMQTERDVKRIEALGAKNVEALGNTKFDEAVEGLDADPAYWRKELGIPEGKPVVVIGSTRGEDEERLVLDAVAEIGLGKVSVVHAPRHLERVPELARLAQERLGQFSLRSQGAFGSYVILDTYGELAKVYSIADVVVIGGGFSNLGGQNLIQPLAHGKPVLHGPHMQNFADVTSASLGAGASLICATADELSAALAELIGDPQRRRQMGEAARRFVDANRGASARYANAIAEMAKDAC